jgi:hypothetical protein
MSGFIKNIRFNIDDDSNNIYHGNKDYISASGLKMIKQSPLHFVEEEKKESEAMIFGSAYHTFILEPDKFDKEYHIFDETDILKILISEGSQKPRGTNKYKEWYSIEMEKAAGKQLIDLPTSKILESMKRRLFSHRYVKSLLTNGEAEKSIYTTFNLEESGEVNVKIRPDYLKQNKRIIVDLKTTSDASVNGFPRNAAEFDYHIQSALYADIMEAIEGKGMPWEFFFIAQEKTKPFAFNIFLASPQFQGQGRYEYERLLALYQYCKTNNHWPGYQCFCESKYGVNVLNLPPYAIKEINWFDHKL